MSKKGRWLNRVYRRLSHKPKSKNYFSIKQKLEILEYAMKYSNHKAATLYKVDRQNIRKWKRHENEWKALDLHDQHTLKFINPKKSSYDDILKKLNEFVEKSLSLNQPMTTDIMIRYILEIAPEMNTKSYRSLKEICYKFMDENDYCFRRFNQVLEENDELEERIQKFQSEFDQILKEGCWKNDEIYNMDQTGLSAELLPSKLINKRGVKCVNVKIKGQTAIMTTGILLVRADGKKFKFMLIYKGSYSGKIYDEVTSFNNYNDHMICCTQPNAWCDSKIMNEWIEKIWKKVEPGKRKLLILDNLKAHIDLKDKIEYNPNIKVVYLPKNTTRLLQPLDLTINNLLKKSLREIWVRKFDKSEQKLSRKEIANRINEAWESIKESNVISGFQKAKLCKVQITSDDWLTDPFAC